MDAMEIHKLRQLAWAAYSEAQLALIELERADYPAVIMETARNLVTQTWEILIMLSEL